MIQVSRRTSEGRMVLLTLVLLLGLLLLGGAVEASPITSFTGNGYASNTTSVGIDATVNYAVFTSGDFSTDASGILSSFKAGLSSPAALDLGTGIYVYVFQVVNNGSNTTTITGWSTGRASAADVTSWGYFNGAVFTDAGGNVGANNSLDSGSVGLVSDGGVNPSLIWKASTSVQAALNIPAGATSSLMVYTSSYGPDWFSGQFNGGGVGAMVSDPGPGVSVPEPGTILLMTLGLAGLAGYRRGFHKKEGER